MVTNNQANCAGLESISSRPLLSIIIPAYQAEKSIERLLDSILAWKNGSFEVIVVNDGSIDETPRLIASKANYDSRVHLINQENRGRSAARNVGVSRALGEWMMFADADDYLVDGWWNCVLDAIKLDNDLAIFAMDRGGGSDCITSELCSLPSVCVDANDLYRSLVDDTELLGVQYPKSFEWSACWARLYRRRTIEELAARNGGVVFPVGLKFSEDRLFNLMYLNAMGHSAVVFDYRCVYYWDLGLSSTVAKALPDDPNSIIAFTHAVDAAGALIGGSADRKKIIAMEAASQFRRSSSLPISNFAEAVDSWQRVINSGILKGLGNFMGAFIGGGAWAFKPSIALLLKNHPKLSLLLAHIVTTVWTFVKVMIRRK